MVAKREWEIILNQHHHKCVFCGVTEKQTDKLEQAHLLAQHKGGTQVVPLCPTCHRRFDRGKATVKELKNIGITPEQYKKIKPKGGSKKESGSSKTILDDITKEFY